MEFIDILLKTKHCFHGKDFNVNRENVLLRLIHFIELKFYFYSFFKFKLFYHPNCRRCSKTLLSHYVEYLLPNKYNFKCEKIFMWHTHIFKQVVQLAVFSVLCIRVCGVYACMHVCVCVCVFLLYLVFLMLLRQLPYLKFHNKIFATNWSQI